MDALVLVYLAGVVVGLLLTDGSPVARVGLALLWPLGPLALAITLAVLVAASPIAFPLFGAIVGALALAWWLLA